MATSDAELLGRWHRLHKAVKKVFPAMDETKLAEKVIRNACDIFDRVANGNPARERAAIMAAVVDVSENQGRVEETQAHYGALTDADVDRIAAAVVAQLKPTLQEKVAASLSRGAARKTEPEAALGAPKSPDAAR